MHSGERAADRRAGTADRPPPGRAAAGGLPLRAGLVLLVVAALLPVLVFAGWMVLRMAQTQSAAIRQSGQDLTRTLAVAVDRELTAVAVALQALTSSHHLETGDLAAFHRQAGAVLRHQNIQRDGNHIVLCDADGQQLVNTRRPFGDPLPRAAVHDLVRRVAETGRLQISEVFSGAVSGQPQIAVAVPVERPVERKTTRDRPTRLVLAMSMPATVLGSVLESQGLPEGWVASLWDRRGITITRSMAAESVTGTPAPADAVRQAAAPSGSFPFTAPDGTAYFNAFVRSGLTGWTVTVGVPQAVIDQPVRQSVALALAGGGILLALSVLATLAVGRRIAGPVAALADSALALGADDAPGDALAAHFVERTLVREVNAVAGALGRTARRLRDSEAQKRLVMLAVGLGTWRFDPRGGHFQGWGRSAALLGVPAAGGASLEAWIRNVAAEHRDRIRTALHRQGPAAGEFEIEFPVGSPDGRVRWLAMRGAFLADPDPKAARAVGILEDVSERRRAHEEQLGEVVDRHAADRRLFAAIIEGSTDLIVAMDQELRFILFNNAYQRAVETLFGRRPEIGGSLPDMLAGLPEAQAAAVGSWGRALAGERFTVVDELGDPALRRQRFEMVFDAIVDSSGRRIGAFHIARDVSERERTQEALRHAEETLHQARKMEAIGQLTGGIAHDFNNLLQAIGSALYLIEAEGSGRSAAALSMATRAVDRGATLTQHLLAFSRRQRLEPKAVDVGALIRGMGGLLERTLGGTIRIVTGTEPGLWAARVDPNQLEMALLNLAINARDAMPGGGTLTIRSANSPDGAAGRPAGLAPGDSVCIAVADTGSGMTDEVAARAFEPFFTTKGIGHGTGLGLSMVHGLAAQSGGMATLDTRLGAGTTVTLHLPRAGAADTAVEQREAPPPRPARPATILVAEDEALVRMTTATILEQAGYRVMEADGGAEALEVLEREPGIDLLLTDYAMPGMTGLELMRRVHAGHPGLPALMVTGYAEMPEAAAWDGLAIIQKPFRPDDLLTRVAAALATACVTLSAQ